MGFYWNEHEREPRVARIVVSIIAFVASVILISLAFGPIYGVWQQEQQGKASLARATQDRQIAVQEAQAKMESAKLLAQAEVERARGVAEANKIIGESLKDNEGYLRYLWINGLQTNQMQVIYVPTEAGLPILEAGQRR